MWAERARVTARTVGELLITFGMLLLLFCAYQLFYTDVVADQRMSSEMQRLHKLWTEPQAPAPAPRGQPPVATFDTQDSAGTEGQAFAIIHIPRLGAGNSVPILQGTSLDVLGRGVGHYKDSVMPGQVGNFAVAGHRKTHGEPFRNLDRMRAGDFIVVETKDAWYTYREDRAPYIVAPTDVGVVAPVPDRPGATPTQRLITLTTCNPWWASTQRMIVVGTLTGVQPRSAGVPAVLGQLTEKYE
jgi:sortase A